MGRRARHDRHRRRRLGVRGVRQEGRLEARPGLRGGAPPRRREGRRLQAGGEGGAQGALGQVGGRLPAAPEDGALDLLAPVVSADRRAAVGQVDDAQELRPGVPRRRGRPFGLGRDAELRLVVRQRGGDPGHGRALHVPGGRRPGCLGVVDVPEAPEEVPPLLPDQRGPGGRSLHVPPRGLPGGAGPQGREHPRQAHQPAARPRDSLPGLRHDHEGRPDPGLLGVLLEARPGGPEAARRLVESGGTREALRHPHVRRGLREPPDPDPQAPAEVHGERGDRPERRPDLRLPGRAPRHQGPDQALLPGHLRRDPVRRALRLPRLLLLERRPAGQADRPRHPGAPRRVGRGSPRQPRADLQAFPPVLHQGLLREEGLPRAGADLPDQGGRRAGEARPVGHVGAGRAHRPDGHRRHRRPVLLAPGLRAADPGDREEGGGVRGEGAVPGGGGL